MANIKLCGNWTKRNKGLLHYYAPTLEFVLHIIFPKHRNFGSPYLTDSAYPYSHVGLCHLITKFTIPSYNYLSFGVYEIELSFSLTRNLSIVFSKKKKSLYISTNANSLLGDLQELSIDLVVCFSDHLFPYYKTSNFVVPVAVTKALITWYRRSFL